MKKQSDSTKAWQQYQEGINYKDRIGLYTTVDKNERFFVGDQWNGVPHTNLPTPVLNVLERGLGLLIAAVADRRIKMRYSVMGQSETNDLATYIKQIGDYSDVLWERLKMDYMSNEFLQDAGISGDGIAYIPWDPDIVTGQDVTGDMDIQAIDNVNYYPGNPNSPNVQKQPYIIIAFRELISNVREEAKRNGVKTLDSILPDDETEYTSGDMGKIELDESEKCTVLLKMWKKKVNGKARVFMEKSTRAVVIQPETQTKLSRYPVALMNWKTRKNCCHGISEITSRIPNQIYINKAAAMAQVCQMNMGFPKYFYDQTRITSAEAQGQIGVPVPVNGTTDGVMSVVQPGTMSYDVPRFISIFIEQTLNMMGANSALRGDINDPDNTSAFLAVHDTAVVPLEAIQQRYYAFIEDIGLIFLDYMKGYYAGRMIPIKAEVQAMQQTSEMGADGKPMMQPVTDGMGNPVMEEVIQYVPMPDLSDYEFTVKIDVGPTNMWSELQSMQTMDNLLNGGFLRPSEYYERTQKFGMVPDADKLAKKRKEEEQQAEQAAMMQPTA